MKKRILLFVLFFLVMLPLSAQDGIIVNSSDKKVAVGLKIHGGLNMSNFTGGDNYAGFGMRLGANAGAGVSLRFVKRHDYTPVEEDGWLGLDAGVAFEMSGTKASPGSGISMMNVGVPIFFQVYPVSWLYFEAGPEFFLNLSTSPNTTTIGLYELELNGHKANDIKLGVGAGVKLGNFGIGARYLIGMVGFASNLPWKCNVIQVSLSYTIPLGGRSSSQIIIEEE